MTDNFVIEPEKKKIFLLLLGNIKKNQFLIGFALRLKMKLKMQAKIQKNLDLIV
jgi:phosphopantothenoylcysteine decarboxylase/phosphopantothenate--cysteine ligase